MNIGKMDWQQLSRRRFLIGSAAAAFGVAALGSVILDETPASAFPRLQLLAMRHAHTLNAFAEAVLPVTPGFPSISDTGVIRRFDEELYFVDDSIQDDVAAALDLLEWLPIVTGYFARFSNLPLTDRTAFIDGMLSSRLETFRAVASNLKNAIHFLHYAHPASWTWTGYDGPFARVEPKQSEQRMYYAAKGNRA